MGRLKETTVSTRVILEHIAQDCMNSCWLLLITIPISYILHPVWHQKEQQLPQETQHMQQDEMCFFPFPAPFVTCSQPINTPASCLHFISCFGSTSCSMTPYSISGLLHPQAPILHLAPSSLQKPESQPTLLHIDAQNLYACSLSLMQHPLQFLGHSSPFPTNTFGHALPHE